MLGIPLKQAPLYSEVADGPSDGEAFWLNTEDNIKLRVGLWRDNSNTKGTVFYFLGRASYIELCGVTASRFKSHGYDSFIVDWRGQGLSDRVSDDPDVGHVHEFADYQKDVTAMFSAAEELALPKPWFLLTHSLGATIGLQSLLNGLPVTACANTAPLWDLNLAAWKRTALIPIALGAKLLKRDHAYVPGGNGASYPLSNPFEGNRLTSDPEMYRYLIRQAEQYPRLQNGDPSIGWVNRMLATCRNLSKKTSPNIPAITFYGDGDILCDIRAIRQRMADWPNGKLTICENARHALLIERPEIRNKMVDEMSRFFYEASA